MRLHRTDCVVAAIVLAIVAGISPGPADAKSGRDRDDRSEFRGLVEQRPQDGLHGRWIVGGRAYDTGASTEYDQEEGPLAVGACAKVELRDGRVHEIDSEPMRDCR